jgi:hypothetical protein
MQGPAWVSLFRRIPAELHDTLVLVLNTGAEVVVNSIIRLERDFALLRGRMAGTMDAGRVTIVPFDQIVYVAVNKKMKEDEAQTFLGKPVRVRVEAPEPEAEEDLEEVVDEEFLPETPAAPEPAAAAAPAANGTEPETAPAPAEGAAPARPAPVSKSVLLARLRARLGKDGSGKAAGS